MKSLATLLLLSFAINAYAQNDIKPGKESLASKYGNEATRLFQDVLIRNMPYYFVDVNEIAMYKGDQLLDNLSLKQTNYLGGGFPIYLQQVKPRYYALIASKICTSKNSAETKGCELNVKKLCYQLVDDFYFFAINGIKYNNDTLTLKLDMGDDSLFTNIKFAKNGMIGNSMSYLVSGGNRRYKYKKLRAQAFYSYNNVGDIVARKITTYKEDKSIESTIETSYDNQGSRTNEIKKTYEFNRDGSPHIFTDQASFVYDAQHRLIKNSFVHNGKPGMEYSVTYEKNYIEVFKNTPASNQIEMQFKYRLVD